MRRLLILALLLCAAPASAAVYYVDCGAAAGGDGSLATPWDAAADVNAASFNAGDSILFKKGCTWREQLTVPSSGSAGNVITFGAYGSGANPILSGANIITPGSAWATTSATWTTTWSKSLLADDFWGGATQELNWRQVLLAADTSTSGTRVRLTFEAAATQSLVIDGVSIGARSGTSDDFSAAPTRVTFDTGNNGFTIAAGQTKVSDAITFTLDETVDNMVAIYHGSSNSYTRYVGSGTAYSKYSEGSPDESQTQTVAGYTSRTYTVDINKVEVETSPPANVWQSAVTTQPRVVLFDGERGTQVAALGSLASAKQWYWAANVLYVYAASDPDTLYTNPGIEVGYRDNVVLVSNKNYTVVDGLTLQAANADYIYAALGTSTANTIRNCDIRYAGAGSVVFYDTGIGASNVVTGNSIHDGIGNGINFYKHTGSGAGTETTISNNTIYSVTFDGINYRGNYGIIEGNLVHDSGSAGGYWGIHLYSGAAVEGTGDNNIIRRNHVYNQTGTSLDGGGFANDRWCDSNSFYYNLSHNNSGPGFEIYDSDSITLYNNTAYANASGATGNAIAEFNFISASNLTNNLIAKNNIGYATVAGVYAVYVDATTYDNTLTITNNDWYRASGNWYFWNATGGATLATWNGLTGVGTDLNADPLFVSTASYNLRPQPNSPAINAGVDVGLTTDYAGNRILGLPDIGAYEYGGCTSYSLGRNLEPIRYYPSGCSPSGI